MAKRVRTSSQNSLRDRSNLLGPSADYSGSGYYHSSAPTSGRSTPLPHIGGAAPAGQRYADDLEGQNDEQLEGLSLKVKMLKDLTIGIGNEVRDSTVQLTQMNDAFAETSGILSGTFRRLNNMAERQGCRWLWWIMFLVIVFWFFVIFAWFRR